MFYNFIILWKKNDFHEISNRTWHHSQNPPFIEAVCEICVNIRSTFIRLQQLSPPCCFFSFSDFSKIKQHVSGENKKRDLWFTLLIRPIVSIDRNWVTIQCSIMWTASLHLAFESCVEEINDSAMDEGWHNGLNTQDCAGCSSAVGPSSYRNRSLFAFERGEWNVAQWNWKLKPNINKNYRSL